MTAPTVERGDDGRSPVAVEPALPDAPTVPPGGEARPPSGEGAPEAPASSVPLTCGAAFLSAAAAGWMAAGLFSDVAARAVAVLGALLGAGIIALSYRTRRPSVVQYLALPVAAVVGALLVLPDATGGSSNLPSLLREALEEGGLGQPPLPFDPGWRFLLLVFTAVLGTGAAAVATGTDRPRLALAVPLPVVFATAMVQPSSAALVSSVVSLSLLVGALTLAYGVELGREGATSGRFETRRVLRGVGAILLLAAVLAGTSRAGFLFPESDDEVVIPPQRPRTAAAQADRVVFSVRSERQIPWRLGVLDVYDGTAWLTAPFRSGRLVDVADDGSIPGQAAGEASVEATFVVSDLPGHVVPGLASPWRVETSGFDVTYDPRTQALRLPTERVSEGMTYTVEGAAPPAGEELADAPVAAADMQEFLEAPPPPPEVSELLAEAPDDRPYARLQFVRQAFYQQVVASGAGNPTDLPPARVVELLQGKEGTPFEIAAAEAVLARWAGVPARVGYGYFGGDPVPGEDGALEVRPKHGSTWLEVHFQGHGWVPIVGTPPRAKGSLSDGAKNDDPAVQPTDELALVVYVPVEAESLRQTYEVARYWLLVALPYVAAGALAAVFYPGFLKLARRRRRGRWAARRGPREQVAVAYAELRDVARDLDVGLPSSSPLEFVAQVEEDAEHSELAWLVTRALWGDLTRDLRPEDVEAAREMSRSVRRRLLRANPASNRVLAFASRTSLRDPYSDEVPNVWPRDFRLAGGARGLARLLVPRGRRRWEPALRGTALVLVAFLVSFGACGDRRAPDTPIASSLPDRLVQDEIGDVVLARETGAESAYERASENSLVGEGRVFSIREGDTIQGSLQIAAFRKGLDASPADLQEGVRRAIGTGRFERQRIGAERAWVLQLPEQRLLLWFSPDGTYFQLLVARRAFEGADDLFARLLAYQRGDDASPSGAPSAPPPVDPRRGVLS